MADLVLIVEDEDDIRELLEYNLKQEGFEVFSIVRGDLAFDAIKQKNPQLVLLDLMLPGMTGIEICKKVRSDAQIKSMPIIMVTAKDTESDIVVGLELGADDYIAKPFSPKELIARCKAVLRRQQRPAQQAALDHFISGELKVDLLGHQAILKGEKLPLTLTEFKLLKELLSSAGQVMTRRRLLGLVVGSDVTVTDRTIDVHLASLRKKLGSYGSAIETERGVGYRFKSEA
jgi:DNA-binding response OmpR family regulator